MDGDTEFPTICGTGAEDFVAQSFGIQETPYLYHGANLVWQGDSTVVVNYVRTNEEVEMKHRYISMYRWHLLDPIYWEKECRVTVQQIGCCLYERFDDWSTTTFWYEPIPSAPLPPMISREKRLAGLDELLLRYD